MSAFIPPAPSLRFSWQSLKHENCWLHKRQHQKHPRTVENRINLNVCPRSGSPKHPSTHSFFRLGTVRAPRFIFPFAGKWDYGSTHMEGGRRWGGWSSLSAVTHASAPTSHAYKFWSVLPAALLNCVQISCSSRQLNKMGLLQGWIKCMRIPST